MGQPNFKVCSITHAEKGIRLLNENGFHAIYKKTPDLDSADGCCYTIYVTKGNRAEALSILQAGHVRLTGESGGDRKP